MCTRISKHESASAHIEKDRGRRSGDQRPAAGRTPRPRGPLLAAAGRGRPTHAPTAAAHRASRRPPCAPPQLPPPAATPLPSSLPGAAELCGADGPRCGQLPAETRRAEQGRTAGARSKGGRTAGARSKGGRPAGARSKGGIHSPPYDSDTSCFRSSVHYAG